MDEELKKQVNEAIEFVEKTQVFQKSMELGIRAAFFFCGLAKASEELDVSPDREEILMLTSNFIDTLLSIEEDEDASA